ncbi:hypothetical protein ANT2_0613 [plant metagenome]|uniref:Uncharacterized protein n=1 Tax=plant metagenome TaxID=1297885 RepID=A0A484V6N9_9ZZZZ
MQVHGSLVLCGPRRFFPPAWPVNAAWESLHRPASSCRTLKPYATKHAK